MTPRRLRAIEAAKNWILRAGVQIRNPRLDVRGAFNAWYDLDLGQFQYVYPEITGYGITTLLYMDAYRGDPGLLGRACAAGDWVARRALHRSGGIRPRDYYARQERSPLFSFDRHLVVTFDSGMVLFGLTNLYRATGRASYLRAARRIGDFLVDRAQRENGLFYACLSPNSGQWMDKPDKWSTQSGSYHAKLALGLLHLRRLTGLEKYGRSAERVCRASLKLQRPSGRYVSYRDSKMTHLHPHLYSAEGMLAAGLALEKPEFLRSAAKAVRWALLQQRPDGGLPCAVGEGSLRNVNQRCDTLAQALRLAAMAYGLGLLPDSVLKPLAALEHKLLTYQKTSRPQAGGFYYGQEMSGESRRHLNFWCTAFALQALEAHQRVLDGSLPRMDHFI